MKIEELIIDGFKSYATRTVISNWDSQFNAITGLNGSGKSNILDAICFVLGITSMTTVRASNLQDLIYKRGQAGVTKASVTIVFNNSEISKSPIGFQGCAVISVTRQIILGGSSKYLINGHKAQQQTVLNLFQSVQLNINNPNFLIMQGKITKVLNMKPSEILALIEEASGTRTFEERKVKAQKTMAKKDAKLAEIRDLLREAIEPKLDKLRNEKRSFLEYQQTQIDLEKLTRVVAAHDFRALSQKFTTTNDVLNTREQTMQDLGLDVERLENEIKTLNEDLAQIKLQREQELQKDGKIRELEAQEQSLTNDLTRLGTSQDIVSENHREEERNQHVINARIVESQAKLDSVLEACKDYEQGFHESTKSLEALKQEFTRKEELLTTLSTGVSSTGNISSGYAPQINELKEKLNESQRVIETCNLKIEHLKTQIRNDQPKLQQAESENKSLREAITKCAEAIKSGEQELSRRLGFDPELIPALKQQESELLARVNPLRKELRLLEREMGNVGFQYSRPHPEFDDSKVRGVVTQLFDLPDKYFDKALALEVCAGGRLYNVIVDNAEIASQLLERGQLKRRFTIIPLDKIQSRTVDQRTIDYAKSIAPNKVELALNMIDFDPKLMKAMQYIFGNTFICSDPDTASKITFDPRIRTRSITLEGDIYDPEGNLSGGMRKNNSAILIKMLKFNSMSRELNTASVELDRVRSELGRLQELSENAQSLQNDLSLKKHQHQLLVTKLENNPASKLIKQNEANEQEIEQLSATMHEATDRGRQIRSEIAVVEKDIREFNNDRGSKLSGLKKEVDQIKKDLEKRQQQMEGATDKFQSMQIEIEQQRSDIVSLQESLAQSHQTVTDLIAQKAENEQKMALVTELLNTTRAELEDEKAHLIGLTEEMSALGAAIKQKTDSNSDKKLEIQRLGHDISKLAGVTTNMRQRLDELLCDHEWLADTNVVSSVVEQWPNINLEDSRHQLQMLEEKFLQLKRKVNVNIMSMIDNIEKKEAALKQMIKTVLKDKNKIEKTVDKLNGYKRDTLNETYKKVSTDFGQIFADLLPGSFAKLVPVNMMDVTHGLEVKVQLGEVWKLSLVELSGGQRSLIALSLIMALLQFKPAPMYILDEVDAALDLSHTQNIGHLIKTRFKGAQFIVVSLKEGMFTNANRVFRTRFQDGTSVVLVM